MPRHNQAVADCACCGCSVGTVLFTALGISVAAIALHGGLRVPDDLFTDEVEVSPQHTFYLRMPLVHLRGP